MEKYHHPFSWGPVYLIGIFLLLLASGCASTGPGVTASTTNPDEMADSALAFLVSSTIDSAINDCKATDGESGSESNCELDFASGSAVDSVIVDRDLRVIHVRMNDAFAQIPWREESVAVARSIVRTGLGSAFADWNVRLTALETSLDSLIPNLYRSDTGDSSKLPQTVSTGRRLTTNLETPWRNVASLSGRHIAIWPSHGWYYEQRLDRWEWQRARLFQTVEDLFPMSFVVPYLAPMLEAAGAHVHMPRERDTQSNEVIVDHDDSTSKASDSGGSRYLEVGETEFAWRAGESQGFRPFEVLTTENPFAEGGHRVSTTHKVISATATWVPDIPEGGDYAVYISYGKLENPTSDARYTIFHSGGSTEFSVDQGMKNATWVYLGTFPFVEGVNPEIARVDLSNVSSDPGKEVSADAIRFGGGMGSVSRSGRTSGRPRFTEGARYYMQFSGMPDALVYNVTETDNDYVDDYRGRAEWVNYLVGAPFGPNKDREEAGLNVPVDISLAFHTDAGITPPDETIGTLMIYSSEGTEAEIIFPDGVSRFANRDLGDIMQTAIVSDIIAKYDSTWSRRAIWDRDYSEAVRPNVPGVLLELMSHQNFSDMRFGLDPRFRFDVARSIYKSMLLFLANQNGFEPIVQPLPVDHLQAVWAGEEVHVSWQAVPDPLEPSANPDGYVVYIRENDGGFDNGRWVEDARFVLTGARAGVVYSFRVTGVNAGGEGMPSEEVSAGRAHDTIFKGDALIVAAFDRISAPASIDNGSFQGFANFIDEGVSDRYDLSFIGTQYDFDADSPWLDDDSPGHGASYSTFETQVRTGNSFNYPSIHGAAILSAGYSFSTMSDELLDQDENALSGFEFIDIILGEEKTTAGPGRLVDFQAITPGMKRSLRRFVDNGASILISGAHVATDFAGPQASQEDREFASEVLGFSWRTDHAVERGDVYSLEGWLEQRMDVRFNTLPTADVYRVESPDAIEASTGSEMLMRYSDNNMGAMVGREGPGGVVVMGFPFETIEYGWARAELMRAIVAYLR